MEFYLKVIERKVKKIIIKELTIVSKIIYMQN